MDTSQHDTVEGRMLYFEATDGVKLHGFIASSKRPNGSVVIHLHGMTGNGTGWPGLFRMYAGALEAGFDVLSITTRGAGIVTRFWKGEESYIAGTYSERFEDCVKDVGGAIKAVKALGYKGAILGGHSTGCQKVAYYQSVKRDRFVKGMILLAPADDYGMHRKRMGRQFRYAALVAKAMVQAGQGDQPLLEPLGIRNMTAARFHSVSDPAQPEAAMFNYSAPRLELFSRIKVPVFAAFGSREQFRDRPVKEYMKKLSGNAGGEFSCSIIPGGDHGFRGKEELVSTPIGKWVASETA